MGGFTREAVGNHHAAHDEEGDHADLAGVDDLAEQREVPGPDAGDAQKHCQMEVDDGESSDSPDRVDVIEAAHAHKRSDPPSVTMRPAKREPASVESWR